MRPIRVVIVDPRPVVCLGIRAALGRAREIRVVGQVTSPGDLPSAAKRTRARIVLYAVHVEDTDVKSILSETLSQAPNARFVFYGGASIRATTDTLLHESPHGHISILDSPDVLLHAIRTVFAGGTYVAPFANSESRRPGASLPAATTDLTPRERDIFLLLVEGKSSKEIAALLHISPRTVSVHRSNLMRKLHTHSIVGLLHHAMETGVLTPHSSHLRDHSDT